MKTTTATQTAAGHTITITLTDDEMQAEALAAELGDMLLEYMMQEKDGKAITKLEAEDVAQDLIRDVYKTTNVMLNVTIR